MRLLEKRCETLSPACPGKSVFPVSPNAIRYLSPALNIFQLYFVIKPWQIATKDYMSLHYSLWKDGRKRWKKSPETLTAIILKKSSSPRVSKIDETVCLAMVSRSPFILPLTSTKITTSFGEVAAWMYLRWKTKHLVL